MLVFDFYNLDLWDLHWARFYRETVHLGLGLQTLFRCFTVWLSLISVKPLKWKNETETVRNTNYGAHFTREPYF